MKMRYLDGDPTTRFASADRQLAMPQAAGFPFAPTIDVMATEPPAAWTDYWRSIKKRGWWLVALAAVVLVLSALYAYSIVPVFRSTSTLLIESGKTKITSIDEVYNAVSQDREYYQTQVEILRSRDIALRTVVATRLWDEPEFNPRTPPRSLLGHVKDMFSSPAPAVQWTPEALADATVGRFLGGVTIEPVRLSQLVKISFDANDPALAAKLANATANSYIDADREARAKLNVSVTGLLQDRLSALREKLLQSEQELQLFRERGGLVNMGSGQGVAGQQLSDIAQRLTAARVRRTELDSSYGQIEGVRNGDYSSIPAVISAPGVADAQMRLSIAQSKFEEVSRTLGDENLRVIEARAELTAAQQRLRLQTQAVIGGLKREALAARATESSLQAALTSARGDVQGVNRQEFQLGVLEREVQANKSLYELFLSRTKETSVSNNLQSAVGRVVDPAAPPTAPLRPNKGQIIMLSVLMSLAIGAALCVLLDKLSKKIQGSDEAEHRLGHAVLATLPALKSSEAAGLTRSYLDNPNSNHAEAIRAARTNILLSKFDIAHKVVLVTSTLAGEGKTSFVSNLAFAHAQTKRTLLIDCDMRTPQIGARLGLPPDAKGLSNLVAGTADMKDCVHGVPGSSLLVMPAGDLQMNPEEMLLSPQFRETLKSLANRVEVVLIDSPPVNNCSDALIIAQQVGNTIYVVKAKDTPHPLALKGIERLRRAGASILGLVLNNMETSSGRRSRSNQEQPAYEDSRQGQATQLDGSWLQHTPPTR